MSLKRGAGSAKSPWDRKAALVLLLLFTALTEAPYFVSLFASNPSTPPLPHFQDGERIKIGQRRKKGRGELFLPRTDPRMQPLN